MDEYPNRYGIYRGPDQVWVPRKADGNVCQTCAASIVSGEIPARDVIEKGRGACGQHEGQVPAGYGTVFEPQIAHDVPPDEDGGEEE